MATQTVEFRAATGLSVTAKLFSAGSDTEVASVSATEATNRKGTYQAAYTDVAAGEYVLIALSSGTPVASWWVTLTLSTATFQVYERVDKPGIVDSVLPAVNAGSMSASDGRPTTIAKNSILRWTIFTRNRSTGVLTDADSTPTVSVRKNGSASAETVTIIKRAATTGIYDCSFNPSNESDGDVFQFTESSVVNSISYGTTFAVSVPPTLDVVVDPLVSTVRGRISENTMTLFIGEEIDVTLSIVDANNVAVDLTTKNLIAVFEDYWQTDIASVTNFTISGAGNNVVTFTVPAAVTVAVTNQSSPHRWSLRDIADGDRVLALGPVVVRLAAIQD